VKKERKEGRKEGRKERMKAKIGRKKGEGTEKEKMLVDFKSIWNF